MDNNALLAKSIFDIIEERSEAPVYFAWANDPVLFKTEPEQFLFEGELTTMDAATHKFKTRRYVLTLNALIRYKKSNSDVPKTALRLKNPRIEKIEDKEHDMYGFRLIGFKSSAEMYTDHVFSQDEWVEKLRKVCISFNLSYRYSFDKLLGKGNFAKVHRAIKKRDGKEYAIKTIEKAKILEHPRNLQSMEREVDILRRLNHTGIIKLYEVYENDLYIHIVLEYLRGGELFQQLQSKGIYSELDASLVFKCILEALAYCHQRNVVHRDIKPENLILTGTNNKWDLKIADFGLATVITPGVAEMMRCGSPGYVAPEVLNNLGYDTKADIFSAGIILFVILTGASPFYGKNYHEVLMKNKEGNVSFVEQYWKPLSAEARDLAAKMVAKNPADRISAKDALMHPWFRMEHAGSLGLATAQENMKKYNDKDRFNMEKIKPEFSMVTCSPLLNSRGPGSGVNSPMMNKAFVPKSPMPLAPRLIGGPGSDKEDMKGGVLIRNLNKKFADNSTKMPSSFTKNARAGEDKKTAQEEDNGEFCADDIDEQSSPGAIPKPIFTQVHTPFAAHGNEEKKAVSAAKKVMSATAYVKSIATPMQNRRVMKKAPEGKPGSYFQKLGEAASKAEVPKATNETETGQPEAPARISTFQHAKPNDHSSKVSKMGSMLREAHQGGGGIRHIIYY